MSEVGKKTEKKTEKKAELEKALEKLEKEIREVENGLKSLNEIAEELEKVRKRERELVEGGRYLMEKIEQKVAILDTLGLIDSELTEKLENLKSVFKVKTTNRTSNSVRSRVGRGKRVIIDGEEFESAAEACRALNLEINGDSPVRVLKRWAKKSGLRIIEEEDRLIIE